MVWGEMKQEAEGTKQSCKVPRAMTQPDELRNSMGVPVPIPLALQARRDGGEVFSMLFIQYG